MRTRIGLFLLICLFTFLVTGQIIAQEDETYTGDITSDSDSDSYTITLEEGGGVIITAIAPEDSTLDTYLTLEGPDGNIVAENDDYEFPTTVNSQIQYVAEQTGDYTIIVSNYPGSTGTYELTIQYVSAEEVGVDGGDGNLLETLEPDQVYTGFVDDSVVDRYPITLEAGQGVVIVAEATADSALDTYLSLEDVNGFEVASNDDSEPGFTLNSRIVYVSEAGGEYTIVMSNYPGSSGDYELSVYFVTSEQAAEIGASSGGQPEIDTTPERDPDQEFTGTITSDLDQDVYPLELEAGQGVIAALYATDDSMDTLIYLIDPNGVEVLVNDDRGDYGTLDSQIAFTAEYTGKYVIVVTNYPGFPGDYLLEIYFATPEEVALAEQSMRELLSGTVQTFDTENFRIHYTLEGEDATSLDYIEQVAQTVEEVYTIQTGLGWAAPPSDLIQGGDGRYDVYIVNIPDAYGYASSSSPEGDNPNTEVVEEFARAGYLVLDNDYTDFPNPYRAMRATAAHEFHHVVQSGYDDSEYGFFQWYYESTASWMETVTFPEEEEATIYVEDVFNHPEACFGGQGDADPTGLGVYGTWLFLEYMQTSLSPQAPIRLWENIVTLDGWAAMEATLEEFNTNLPSIVARYHINNLVRDYQFTFAFEETTVRLETVISGTGSFTFTGEGIQEMGANYFQFSPADGEYFLSLDSDTELEMYAIGVTGAIGYVIPLGTGGTIDSDDYDNLYVMVFNPAYDGDLGECQYVDYSIDVANGTTEPLRSTVEVNASQFRALEVR